MGQINKVQRRPAAPVFDHSDVGTNSQWPEIAQALGLSSQSGERLEDGIRIAFPEVEFLQEFIVKDISS
jgi:hypothetical protein